jgi:hypothetical protein
LSASSIGAPPRASLDETDVILAGSQRLHDPLIPSPGGPKTMSTPQQIRQSMRMSDAFEAWLSFVAVSTPMLDDHQTSAVSRRPPRVIRHRRI